MDDVRLYAASTHILRWANRSVLEASLQIYFWQYTTQMKILNTVIP